MTAANHTRIHEAISGVEFPCEYSDLVRQAAAAGADDDTLGHLAALPRRSYPDAASVLDACLRPGPR
jgi:uncharacterized protein DUF2795